MVENATTFSSDKHHHQPLSSRRNRKPQMQLYSCHFLSPETFQPPSNGMNQIYLKIDKFFKVISFLAFSSRNYLSTLKVSVFIKSILLLAEAAKKTHRPCT